MTTTSLAQLVPTPEQFEWALGMWVLALAIIIGIAAGVAKLIDMFRRKPPIDAEFATKKELKSVRGESSRGDRAIESKIDALRSEIKADYQQLSAADERRASGVHKRVDQILAAVSTQTGTITTMGRHFEALQATVENLPCRHTAAAQCGAAT